MSNKSIQDRIRERECATENDGIGPCRDSILFEGVDIKEVFSDWCDNCKANHEARQIQELGHKRINELNSFNFTCKDDINNEGTMCDVDNFCMNCCEFSENSRAIKELKQLCGCGCK